MRSIQFILFVMFYMSLTSLWSQRGIVPTNLNKTNKSAITKALIIGISDYESNSITDLQYAHRDALAMVDYLETLSQIKKPDIQLLINEQATRGAIQVALNRLYYNTNEDDVILIYFAGHGDVESNQISQKGYLLLHDTPSKGYAFGALKISDLQDVISTITQVNKSKVLLITDACRSGNLTGNYINGQQITNNAIQNQFKDATKILSCQSTELSLEGKQWGGGRGIFSYYLIKGLEGEADSDSDGLIRLYEIERYLQNTIKGENLSQPQTPIVDGERNTILATVKIDKQQLDIANQPIEEASQTTATRRKSIFDDPGVNSLVKRFNVALQNKKLIQQDDTNVDDAINIYNELVVLLEKTHYAELSLLKDQLVSSLMEEAQRYINLYLESDDNFHLEFKECENISRYLNQVLRMIQTDDFSYENLKAVAYFYDAASLKREGEILNDRKKIKEALRLYGESSELEPSAAHTFHELGYLYLRYMNDLRKAEENLTIASSLSPTWEYPYINLYGLHITKQDNKKAKSILKLGLQLIPQSFKLNYQMGFHYLSENGMAQNSINFFNKCIELNDSSAVAYHHLAHAYLLNNKLEEALSNNTMALNIMPDEVEIFLLQAKILEKQEKFEEAIAILEKARTSLPSNVRICETLADQYFLNKQKDKAKALYRQCKALSH